MKISLFFHDAALSHSQYLLEAFATNPSISHLTVIYPEGRGQDAIFSAGSDSKIAAFNGFEMIGVRSSRLRTKWGNFFDLYQVIASQKPDYVIVLDEAYSINALMIGLTVKLCGLKIPVVCYGFENIHQSPPLKWFCQDPLKRLWPFIRKTLRYLLIDQLLQPIRRRVIHGALVSYSECTQVIKRAGWNLPTKDQWWGVNVNLFKAHAKVLERKVVEEPKVIAYVGRFVTEKGILDLVKALPLLPKSHSLLLIGAGPDEQLIRQNAIQLGLESRLQIFPPMGLGQLALQLQGIDVLALPSHTEAFWKEQYGRVLVEAMAAGIPVIGSRSGAIPYVIGDDLCTFEEGDLEAICRAVTVALSMNADQRQQLQIRAEQGSAQRFVQAYIDFYHQLSPSLGS